MIFDGKVVGSGFVEVPGGPAYQNRSAFSFHYYCDSFDPDPANPVARRVICDDTIGPLVFEAVHKDLEVFGGSSMMTEGLACTGTNATGYDECRFVMDHLDEGLFSWTDYGLSQGATWDPNAAQIKSWSRTYARAIAGQPINMTFDADSLDFELCFVADPAINAPTEIFASTKYQYRAGRTVTTSPNLRYNISAANADLVHVFGAAAGVGCVHIRNNKN